MISSAGEGHNDACLLRLPHSISEQHMFLIVAIQCSCFKIKDSSPQHLFNWSLWKLSTQHSFNRPKTDFVFSWMSPKCIITSVSSVWPFPAMCFQITWIDCIPMHVSSTWRSKQMPRKTAMALCWLFLSVLFWSWTSYQELSRGTS